MVIGAGVIWKVPSLPALGVVLAVGWPGGWNTCRWPPRAAWASSRHGGAAGACCFQERQVGSVSPVQVALEVTALSLCCGHRPSGFEEWEHGPPFLMETLSASPCKEGECDGKSYWALGAQASV